MKTHTLKHRQKISRRIKELWKDPLFRDKWERGIRNKFPSIEERFWNQVGDHSDSKVCWLWLGSISGPLQGLKYGRFNIGKGKLVKAHRFAYELLVGTIPEGMTLDHVKSRGCISTLCVNPNHLEPVTQRVNTLRGIGIGALNARKTHCKRGHLFNKENTYILKNGRRRCRICRRK